MFSSFMAFTSTKVRSVRRPCGRARFWEKTRFLFRRFWALLLAVFELCDVEQKDLENFEQWECEKYNFSTAFSGKFDLADWRAEILWLDGLFIGVNNSFWHKLLVSMRYSSSKFSDCFCEHCRRMFFLISTTLNSYSLKNSKISSDFLRSFKSRRIELWRSFF